MAVSLRTSPAASTATARPSRRHVVTARAGFLQDVGAGECRYQRSFVTWREGKPPRLRLHIPPRDLRASDTGAPRFGRAGYAQFATGRAPGEPKPRAATSNRAAAPCAHGTPALPRCGTRTVARPTRRGPRARAQAASPSSPPLSGPPAAVRVSRTRVDLGQSSLWQQGRAAAALPTPSGDTAPKRLTVGLRAVGAPARPQPAGQAAAAGSKPNLVCCPAAPPICRSFPCACKPSPLLPFSTSLPR
eukprot:365767-Chlamydomonas_euryale.AAC.7